MIFNYLGYIVCRHGLSVMQSAMGTGPSQSTVSNLDFEPCTVRKFQNSSRGVMAEAITPPPLQLHYRQPVANLFLETKKDISVYFGYI